MSPSDGSSSTLPMYTHKLYTKLILSQKPCLLDNKDTDCGRDV